MRSALWAAMATATGLITGLGSGTAGCGGEDPATTTGGQGASGGAGATGGTGAIGVGGEGGGAPACPTGLVECAGVCVDTDVDSGNCGDCGVTCDAGTVCDGSGTCAVSCQAGLIVCDGSCVDPNTSQTHCGASGDCTGANAGTACAAGEICDGSGQCSLSCQQGLIDCGGTCVDPDTDEAYCGASGDCMGANAGTACAAGEVCDGSGQCTLSCQQGLIDCGGTCIDPDTDENHCGATADCMGANAGAVCLAGEVCNGSGACELSCQQGLIDCNGTCIDPNTDESYCGASADCTGANAGTACLPGEVCNGSGACELSCQQGLIDCGGVCIDPDTDESFCGATGDCTGANAGAACLAGEVCNGSGVCELSCQPGLIDCNGTCADPDTDPTYCGASGDCQPPNSGATCAAGFVCNGSGVCQLSCQMGLVDCSGTCTNTDFDPSHCGACNNACTAQEACVSGACISVVQPPLGLVFLTSSNGSAGFHRYDIAANSWTTPAQPPVLTHTQITNDGVFVYYMGDNNTVYKYDAAGNAWSNHMAGPGNVVSSPIGFFQWFENGFYYCKDGGTQMFVHRNNAWSSFALPGACSSAGTWDAANDELYVRTWTQLGFRVYSTNNDALVRTITDATSVGENSRTGSYFNGFFYGRTFTGSIQKLHSVTGAKTDTLLTPVSQHTATDTDFYAGLIYVSGYSGQPTSFQVFNPSANTLTTLANQPSTPNHSTITVMRSP